MKELKEYIRKRGAPVSAYKKVELINLAKSLFEMNLPNFGLMDVFNHLIMSETENDKEMLASWRSFDEYTLCQNGHI